MPSGQSPEDPKPLREVAHLVKGWIERLGTVWVEGQIIQINKRVGSRTVFLTLRDRIGDTSATVTLSPLTLELAGPLTEGSTVVARVRPSYYDRNGSFSFFCDALTPVGEGQLLARLEQTKRLLQAEGLFDPRRKRRLPFLPRAVGLVTGAGSAAERDVVENARRRWPAVRIVVRHALVQGTLAAEQLVAAVADLDAETQVDVIVVARGGGSVEDLLPFSDEYVVRAVAACRTPVVSAVGHETDSPILDLVADVRASTPTDAGRLVVPDVAEEALHLARARARLTAALVAAVRQRQDWLDAIRARPVLADPAATFDLRRGELAELRHRAGRALEAHLRHEATVVDQGLARVRAMSPKATLERGYSILVGADGVAVTSTGAVGRGDPLVAHLLDGQLALDVREIIPGTLGGRP